MKDTFKVRITGARFGSYWYADKIGEVFKVVNYGGVDYQCQGGKIEGEPAEDFYIDKSDCEIVEDTMEEYKGYKSLKPITVKELILAGANDHDINTLGESYFITFPIPLFDAIDYASSCNGKLQWLVDKGFTEKVEEKYEVKFGDRYKINGEWFLLCKIPDRDEINLICENGLSHGTSQSVGNTDNIRTKDFSAIISTFDWKKIYATRVPYGG
jgi:hypothetical protein